MLQLRSIKDMLMECTSYYIKVPIIVYESTLVYTKEQENKW